MITSTREFYQNFYDVEPVCNNAIKDYLNDIQFTKTLNPKVSVKLINPFTTDDLIEQASRRTKQSIPGADSLSYPYFAVLFQILMLEKLVDDVYNRALDDIFPGP